MFENNYKTLADPPYTVWACDKKKNEINYYKKKATKFAILQDCKKVD